MKESINERVELLRRLMRSVNVDAVIVPGTDPHQSEYVSDHWKFREWLTGFTGSNGTAVVTADEAALWTDSRYFLQAEMELEGTPFVMMRENMGDDPSIREWLAERLDGGIVGIDGRLFSVLETNNFERFCGENGLMLATDFYAADRIWGNRPARPMAPAFVHDDKYAGETVSSKLARVRKTLENAGADALLVTALDDIAWLLNIRGTDVEFSPLCVAYAYITHDDCDVFIDQEKVTEEVKDHLRGTDIHIRQYDDVTRFLERRKDHEVVVLDPNRVSDTLATALPCQKIYARSPITDLKCIKNETQIAGFRNAMERDGAALVRLFMRLEKAVPQGGVTELDVWEWGKQERGRSELYRGDSFAMIAGYKEHGAIVHYEADAQSAATLAPEGLLLVDSGAQYLDGTTDITRTITLGKPTEAERRDYTLVLKGHLALQRAKFPVGTCGVQLDVLARGPLWQQAMTFGHGTGHGVGHFLCCHEGPQSIRTDLNNTPLRPGMVTSDEPGLYKTGEYGIRIENLLLCVEAEKTEAFGDFLAFEPLTLYPYDRQLIDRGMLTDEEVAQINAYHEMVVARLTPLLSADEVAWLQAKCAAI